MPTRACLARALAPRPELLILDEPLSALDIVLQAQLLRILRSMRTDRNLSYLFISHDIAAIAELCERVVILEHGTVVEHGPVERVLAKPAHPHTEALLRDTLPIPGLSP